MHIEIRTVFARCVVLMIRVSQLVSGTAVEQEEQSLLRRCKQNYVRTSYVACCVYFVVFVQCAFQPPWGAFLVGGGTGIG